MATPCGLEGGGYAFCHGRCDTFNNIICGCACIPRKNTTTGGKIAFYLLSPLWGAWLLSAIIGGVVTDMLYSLFWLLTFGCLRYKKPTIVHYDGRTEDGEVSCSKFKELAPNICCNDGGCCSTV